MKYLLFIWIAGEVAFPPADYSGGLFPFDTQRDCERAMSVAMAFTPAPSSAACVRSDTREHVAEASKG